MSSSLRLPESIRVTSRAADGLDSESELQQTETCDSIREHVKRMIDVILGAFHKVQNSTASAFPVGSAKQQSQVLSAHQKTTQYYLPGRSNSGSGSGSDSIGNLGPRRHDLVSMAETMDIDLLIEIAAEIEKMLVELCKTTGIQLGVEASPASGNENAQERTRGAFATLSGILKAAGFDFVQGMFSPNLPNLALLCFELQYFESALLAHLSVLKHEPEMIDVVTKHMEMYPQLWDSTAPWGDTMLTTAIVAINPLLPEEQMQDSTKKLIKKLVQKFGCNPNQKNSLPSRNGYTSLHVLRDLFNYQQQVEKNGKGAKLLAKLFNYLTEADRNFAFIADPKGRNCAEAYYRIFRKRHKNNEEEQGEEVNWDWEYMELKSSDLLHPEWVALNDAEKGTISSLILRSIPRGLLPSEQFYFDLHQMSLVDAAALAQVSSSGENENLPSPRGRSSSLFRRRSRSHVEQKEKTSPTSKRYHVRCATLPHNALELYHGREWVWQWFDGEDWHTFTQTGCAKIDEVSFRMSENQWHAEADDDDEEEEEEGEAAEEESDEAGASSRLGSKGAPGNNGAARSKHTILTSPNVATFCEPPPSFMASSLASTSSSSAASSAAAAAAAVTSKADHAHTKKKTKSVPKTSANSNIEAADWQVNLESLTLVVAVAEDKEEEEKDSKAVVDNAPVRWVPKESNCWRNDNDNSQESKGNSSDDLLELKSIGEIKDDELVAIDPDPWSTQGMKSRPRPVPATTQNQYFNEEERVNQAEWQRSTQAHALLQNLNAFSRDRTELTDQTGKSSPVANQQQKQQQQQKRQQQHQKSSKRIFIPGISNASEEYRFANETLVEWMEDYLKKHDSPDPRVKLRSGNVHELSLELEVSSGQVVDIERVEGLLYICQEYWDKLYRQQKRYENRIRKFAYLLRQAVYWELRAAEFGNHEDDETTKEMSKFRKAFQSNWSSLVRTLEETIVTELNEELSRRYREHVVKAIIDDKDSIQAAFQNIMQDLSCASYLDQLKESANRDAMDKVMKPTLRPDGSSRGNNPHMNVVEKQWQMSVNNIQRILQELTSQTLAKAAAKATTSKAKGATSTAMAAPTSEPLGLDGELKCWLIHRSAIPLSKLPLYAKSPGLLAQIRNCDVVTLGCDTGSGKSTVLPPLLLAEGFKHVFVTQPRRFPCERIATRVGSTFGDHLVGWQVSGQGNNIHHRLLYLTDGLLKEMLAALSATTDAMSNQPSTPSHHNQPTIFSGAMDVDVIMIDEAHERNVNIDLCLAFLAQLIAEAKQNGMKYPKVVIASATLNRDDILRPFTQASRNIVIGNFEVKVPSPYSVEEVDAEGQNPVELSLRLYQEHHQQHKILCFLPSTTEVREAKRIFDKKISNTNVARTLYASQHPVEQDRNIKEGQVYFATNIAETSLTFDCLTHVVDTGLVNRPMFDPLTGRTELLTVPISESQATQRRGRVGRTQEGKYYQMYKTDNLTERFPMAALKAADVSNVEMSLRLNGSSLLIMQQKGLLPTPIPEKNLEFAENRLVALGILTPAATSSSGGIGSSTFYPPPLAPPSDEELSDLSLPGTNGAQTTPLTPAGQMMSQFPVLGTAEMYVAVYSGLYEHSCGDVILRIASLIMSLPNNVSTILQEANTLPGHEEGDISVLLTLFSEILENTPNARVGMSREQYAKADYDAIVGVCRTHGLSSKWFVGPTKRALIRYRAMLKHFEHCNSEKLRRRAFGRPRGTTSLKDNMLRSLCRGFYRNIFHCTVNHGKRATRYTQCFGQSLSSSSSGGKYLVELDAGIAGGSCLSRKPHESHESWVFALQVFVVNTKQSSTVASVKSSTMVNDNDDQVVYGTISLVEKIEDVTLVESVIGGGTRYVHLHAAEQEKLLRDTANASAFDIKQSLQGRNPRIPLKIESGSFIHQELKRSHSELARYSEFNDEADCLEIRGPSMIKVIAFETKLIRELLNETVYVDVFEIIDKQIAKTDRRYETVKSNTEKIMKMPPLFMSLIYRWLNESQLEIQLLSNDLKFLVKGRITALAAAQDMLMSFVFQLGEAAVIQDLPKDAQEWLNPKETILNPTKPKKKSLEGDWEKISKRIRKIVDPERDEVDIWDAVHGETATRESRMEVVAWLAVTKYHCRLEGGFVRDWVVGGQTPQKPPAGTDPKEFVANIGERQGGHRGRPEVHDAFLPKDLDLQLPISPQRGWFDREAFVKDAQKYGLSVSTVHEDGFLVSMLIDAETGPRALGPFTAEFISPTSVATHDALDFDVNNLCCVRGSIDALGQRIPITIGVNYLEIDEIIENIKKKQFRVAREISDSLTMRIQKMESRGWKRDQTDIAYQPKQKSSHSAVLRRVNPGDKYYQFVQDHLAKLPGSKLKHVNYVSNHYISTLYSHQKESMGQRNQGNVNEQYLLHGTSKQASKEVCNWGFDRRHFNKEGMFGGGAYFTDDIRKANIYARPVATPADVPGRVWCYLLICRICLGVVEDEDLSNRQSNRIAPNPGYDSVRGRNHDSYGHLANPSSSKADEYIVFHDYRAEPVVLVQYEVD